MTQKEPDSLGKQWQLTQTVQHGIIVQVYNNALEHTHILHIRHFLPSFPCYCAKLTAFLTE